MSTGINMIDFYSVFVNKLGEPTTKDNLLKYIEYVHLHSKEIKVLEIYTEFHHLLPKSKFKSYEYDINNIFILELGNHIHAHKLLAFAYPIKSFISPLNYFMSKDELSGEEYRNLRSQAAKTSWLEFKSDPVAYENLCRKRSEFMRNEMLSGLSLYLSTLRYSKEGSRESVSLHFKSLWSDPVYKENRKKQMKITHGTQEARAEKSIQMKKSWEDRGEEKRQEFCKTMSIVNNDINKRNSSGSAHKELWSDPEYRNKLLEIRKEADLKKKEEGKPRSNSKSLTSLWADPIKRAEMLDKRRKTREENKLKKEKYETN